MVDSKEKGARGETVIRDHLRKETGLRFERTPLSGASSVKGLKGDLYIPNVVNKFTIECKNYAEDGFSSMVLQGKGDFLRWWAQVVLAARVNENLPMLIYKYNRSKMYCAVPVSIDFGIKNRIILDDKGIAIYLLDELNLKEIFV